MELPWTHFMAATQYYTSFVMIWYPTRRCATQLWNNNDTNRMELLLFVVAHYLTYVDSPLGLGLGILHALTLN